MNSAKFFGIACFPRVPADVCRNQLWDTTRMGHMRKMPNPNAVLRLEAAVTFVDGLAIMHRYGSVGRFLRSVSQATS